MITSDDWLSFGFVYIYMSFTLKCKHNGSSFQYTCTLYAIWHILHYFVVEIKKERYWPAKRSTKVRKIKCLNCLHYVFGQKTHLHCPENFHVKIECNNYQLFSTQWCTDYSFSLFTIRINSSISVQIFSIKWFMNFEFAYHHRKRQGVYLFRFCIEVEENLS